MADGTEQTNMLELATELTIAWLPNPKTRAGMDDVPSFLQKSHEALTRLGAGPQTEEEPKLEYTPAVSVRQSLANKDHIISMIDGKPYKTLKRHLSRHGLTPDQYRERYSLKPDYPMTSASYSEVRRNMAKQIGLGRKSASKSEDQPATDQPATDQPAGQGETAPKRRGRPKKAAA